MVEPFSADKFVHKALRAIMVLSVTPRMSLRGTRKMYNIVKTIDTREKWSFALDMTAKVCIPDALFRCIGRLRCTATKP